MFSVIHGALSALVIWAAWSHQGVVLGAAFVPFAVVSIMLCTRQKP